LFCAFLYVSCACLCTRSSYTKAKKNIGGLNTIKEWGIPTTLKFVRDAICLSGSAGSKLKCDVLGQYYPFWWRITSGGEKSGHRNPTAIIELNAATGEVYIEDTKETTLGSAGHALELKVTTPGTRFLKIVLVERNTECYSHLKNVIKRRWSSIPIDETEGAYSSNSTNIYLLSMSLDDALDAIENLYLGNSIYFFDPLRNVEYEAIEKVAHKRIRDFFKTGTEFIIFLFTSDWFLGRKDFAPLPCSLEEETWTQQERESVLDADSLFGNKEWRSHILNRKSIENKQQILVELYKNRLHRWFRYVLPLPFNPKEKQIFHLILCSNFEVGIRMTKDAYSKMTGNPKYAPSNKRALERFKELHPKTFRRLEKRRRVPLQWRVLWSILKQHEGGICDCMCKDLLKIDKNFPKIDDALAWLSEKGYLEKVDTENAWDTSVNQYRLCWKTVREKLKVDPPPPLKPISPEQLSKLEDMQD